MQTSCAQRDLFRTPEPVNGFPPLTIELHGLIPGKKNNKMIVTKGPNGRPLERPFLITKPEYQTRLKEIVGSMLSQLLSACQTGSGGTLTGSALRSWIASSLPEDDCWTQIPEITIRAELCERGQEGATVVVTRLS